MNIVNLSDLYHKQLKQPSEEKKGLIIGNRIPKDFFITKGTGESDIAIHAGSYHLALKEAGIDKANIISYSSILPPIATRKEMPKEIYHGEVMETIMSVGNGHESERLSAGIIIGWLYEKDKIYGGLVCENYGNYPLDELEWRLNASINEIHENGYQHLALKDIEIHTESFIPQKRFGSVIVALCFTNYYYPVIEAI